MFRLNLSGENLPAPLVNQQPEGQKWSLKIMLLGDMETISSMFKLIEAVLASEQK